MKLIHFMQNISQPNESEFVVICRDNALQSTIAEYSDARAVYVGTLTKESGIETMLPTDRQLTAE